MSENEESHYCPVAATQKLLNTRWTLQIVSTLLRGSKRFNEISKAHQINPRTLCDRLRELEKQGIVIRHVVSTIPPNVVYELTPKGVALRAVFEAMAEWGVQHMQPASVSASKTR